VAREPGASHSAPLHYLPHLSSGEILRMGLSQHPPERWIEPDADTPKVVQHKQRLLQQREADVYRSAPESLPAQAELKTLLLAHLRQDHASLYPQCGNTPSSHPDSVNVQTQPTEPLWDCSQWVADDLLLMQEHSGEYHLTAASLCSPSHWSLAEKFGRPISEIHDPVPGFHARLTPRVGSFFHRLQPGQLFVRFNWGIENGDELAQFPGEEPPPSPGAKLYYRVERQSLRRLPRSEAIVFTIRVYLHPLEQLRQVENALPALLEAIDAAPEALRHYKGLDRLAFLLEAYR